jgi:plasmid stabilization system protein ParE
VVNAVYAACALLCEFPDIGALRPRLASGLRVIFSGRHAIYYTSDPVSLIVVRVLHSSRDTAAIAETGGFSAEA